MSYTSNECKMNTDTITRVVCCEGKKNNWVKIREKKCKDSSSSHKCSLFQTVPSLTVSNRVGDQAQVECVHCLC